MIDKILESSLDRLDEAYNILLEDHVVTEETAELIDQDPAEIYKQQRLSPTYLYGALSELMNNYRFGSYLSTASSMLEYSAYVLDRQVPIKNKLIEQGEDETTAGIDSLNLAIQEIVREREEYIKELMDKGYSLEKATTEVNRNKPLLNRVPRTDQMSVRSQVSGEQEIFMHAKKIGVEGVEPSLSEAHIGSRKIDVQRYLESLHRITEVEKTDPAWHEVDISKMVIFGDIKTNITSSPIRIRKKREELGALMAAAERKIAQYSESEDPMDAAKLKDKEAELDKYKSLKSQLSVGVWRPTDLNELAYGTPSADIKYSGAESQLEEISFRPDEVSTEKPENLTGLFPKLYYMIGGYDSKIQQESIGMDVWREELVEAGAGRYHLKNLIDKEKRGREADLDEETKQKIDKYENMIDEWKQHSGDLRKISVDLYQIVVKYLVDRIDGARDRYHKRKVEFKGNKEIIDKINSDLDILDGIVPEDPSQNIELVIGNTRFVKGKDNKNEYGKWSDGSDISDPADRSRMLHITSSLYDVDLDSSYNVGSIFKRVSVAKMMAQCVDNSIYMWVLNKVFDNIYKYADPDKYGVANIGSDPGVVNKFICSIDQSDSIYGIDSRFSWYLIPFIDNHKSKANRYFSESHEIVSSTEIFQGKEEPISFSDFENWRSGVLDFEDKQIVRDKSGNPIKIGGEGFDRYLNAALYDMSRKGKVDLEYLQLDLPESISETSDNRDSIKEEYDNCLGAIEDIKERISNAKDQSAAAELQVALEKEQERCQKLFGMMRKLDISLENMQKESNNLWNAIFDRAKELQQTSPDALAALEKVNMNKFNNEAFQSWLEETGRQEKLDSIYEKYIDDNKIESELRKMLKTYKDEFIEETEEDGEIHIEPEVKNLVINLAHGVEYGDEKVNAPYEKYDYKRLAEITNERIDEINTEAFQSWLKETGRQEELDKVHEESEIRKKMLKDYKDEFIDEGRNLSKVTPEDVDMILGGSKIDRSNMLSYAVNSLRQLASKSAKTNVREKVAPVMRDMVERDGKTNKFIRAIIESLTAIVETHIVQCSQTVMFGGGGTKTGVSYKDEDGYLRMPPGWDPGELYGRRSNPYAAIRSLAKQIDRISSDDRYSEDQKEEEINKRKEMIKLYSRKMEQDPKARKVANRAHLINSINNPFLPINQDRLSKLMSKMEDFYNGYDVEWETYDVTLPSGDTQMVSEPDMVDFLHKNTPLMQSMGVNVARVVLRYLTETPRSVAIAGIPERLPTDRSKDITDLGAMNASNVITSMLGMIGAKDYLHGRDEEDEDGNKYHIDGLMDVMESQGLTKYLEDISVPSRIVPQLAMELALWVNGQKAKGGLDIDGAKLVREHIRNKLFDYISASIPTPKGELDRSSINARRDIVNKINKASNKVVEQMIKLSTPDADEILDGQKEFDNVVDMFARMKSGMLRLKDSDLHYSAADEADVNVINDLINSANSFRETGNIEELKKTYKNFLNLCNDLAVKKDSERVFADATQHLGNIDRLDNLSYLVSKMDRADGEEREDIKTSITTLIDELSDRGVILSGDLGSLPALMDSAANSRKDEMNRIESIIGRYANIPRDYTDYTISIPELENTEGDKVKIGIDTDLVSTVYSKLNEIRNVALAIGDYHRARETIETENPESAEYEDALARKEQAYETIHVSMGKIASDIGETPGAKLDTQGGIIHKFTGELDKFSKEYKGRLGLYDKLIDIRNDLLGQGLSDDQIREGYVNIYRKLLQSAKVYNLEPRHVASELADRFRKYIEFKREQHRTRREAFGGIEIDTILYVPGSSEPLEVSIYPMENVYDKVSKTLDSGISLEATLINPQKFINSGEGVLSIKYDNVQEMEKGETETEIAPEEEYSIDANMTIRSAVEIDIDKHDEIITYLNQSGKKPVIIKKTKKGEFCWDKLRDSVNDLIDETKPLLEKMRSDFSGLAKKFGSDELANAVEHYDLDRMRSIADHLIDIGDKDPDRAFPRKFWDQFKNFSDVLKKSMGLGSMKKAIEEYDTEGIQEIIDELSSRNIKLSPRIISDVQECIESVR
ncbi:MAG: hypothetical protein GF411_20555 [Candidatus Lokiarchaeota archaeon]|nr:hypothetical protein [Candidatus Lokiarchaeota archaeon]